MKIPGLIAFEDNCLLILRKDLLANNPKESCGLLIGNKQESKQYHDFRTWTIQLIWPCCNAWEPGITNPQEIGNRISENPQRKPSQENRFFIDPREQILAQRWARKNNLQILGSAHSHPYGDGHPSRVDLEWNFNPGLMIIVDQSGEAFAWWIANRHNFQAIKVKELNRE